MKLWRQRLYPSHPAGFEEFSLQLANPSNGLLFEYTSGALSTSILRDANNDMHIGFFDTTFITHVEGHITSYLMDSTYQTAPQLGNQVQLFTLMGVFHDHVSTIKLFYLYCYFFILFSFLDSLLAFLSSTSASVQLLMHGSRFSSSLSPRHSTLLLHFYHAFSILTIPFSILVVCFPFTLTFLRFSCIPR